MTIEMAFNILMSIAAAAIGLSVRRLFSQLDEQAKTIIDMRLDTRPVLKLVSIWMT